MFFTQKMHDKFSRISLSLPGQKYAILNSVYLPRAGELLSEYERRDLFMNKTRVRLAALLLAVRGGDTLVTLDDSLNQLASVAAGQAKSVSSIATAVYLLTASGVESYGYDGTHNWSRDYGAAPQAVINARETLVFISGTVEVLNAPHE